MSEAWPVLQIIGELFVFYGFVRFAIGTLLYDEPFWIWNLWKKR